MAFISQDKIFYGASAFLGLLAIIYFGFEYLVSLSPFTISSILFSTFLALLGLGLYIGGNTSILAYIFSAGAYIVGLFYTMSVFDFGSNPVLISLIVSSGLFASLGYLVTQREFRPEKMHLKYGALALIILLGGLIAYDVGSENVSHEYFLENEADITETVDVGEVTTVKDSMLPYNSESLSFNVCVYNQTGQMNYDSFLGTEVDTMRFGNVMETEDLKFELDGEHVEPMENVPVEEIDARRCDRNIEEGPQIKVSTPSADNIQRRE